MFLDDVGLGRLRDEYSLDLEEEEEEATLGVEAEAIEEEAVELWKEKRIFRFSHMIPSSSCILMFEILGVAPIRMTPSDDKSQRF